MKIKLHSPYHHFPNHVPVDGEQFVAAAVVEELYAVGVAPALDDGTLRQDGINRGKGILGFVEIRNRPEADA